MRLILVVYVHEYLKIVMNIKHKNNQSIHIHCIYLNFPFSSSYIYTYLTTPVPKQ